MHDSIRLIGSLSVCAAMLMLGAVAGHSFLAPEPQPGQVCSLLEHGAPAWAVDLSGGQTAGIASQDPAVREASWARRPSATDF
jgi:hypothetical protein